MSHQDQSRIPAEYRQAAVHLLEYLAIDPAEFAEIIQEAEMILKKRLTNRGQKFNRFLGRLAGASEHKLKRMKWSKYFLEDDIQDFQLAVYAAAEKKEIAEEYDFKKKWDSFDQDRLKRIREILLRRYLKSLSHYTLSHNALYVTIGVNQLAYKLAKGDLLGMFTSFFQMQEDERNQKKVKGTGPLPRFPVYNRQEEQQEDYTRKIKTDLCRDLKKRFQSFVTLVSDGNGSALYFEGQQAAVDEAAKRELVQQSFELFNFWETPCLKDKKSVAAKSGIQLLKDMFRGFAQNFLTPTQHRQSLHVEDLFENNHNEILFSHVNLHHACFQEFAESLHSQHPLELVQRLKQRHEQVFLPVFSRIVDPVAQSGPPGSAAPPENQGGVDSTSPSGGGPIACSIFVDGNQTGQVTEEAPACRFTCRRGARLLELVGPDGSLEGSLFLRRREIRQSWEYRWFGRKTYACQLDSGDRIRIRIQLEQDSPTAETLAGYEISFQYRKRIRWGLRPASANPVPPSRWWWYGAVGTAALLLAMLYFGRRVEPPVPKPPTIVRQAPPAPKTSPPQEEEIPVPEPLPEDQQAVRPVPRPAPRKAAKPELRLPKGKTELEQKYWQALEEELAAANSWKISEGPPSNSARLESKPTLSGDGLTLRLELYDKKGNLQWWSLETFTQDNYRAQARKIAVELNRLGGTKP